MENTIGNKIKKYRTKAGLSQLQLETEIGASPGSLSRIESGKVNPTKETLSKIAKAVELNPSAIADLLDLSIYTTYELVGAINKISQSLDLDTTLQTAVDIMFDLFPNYNGGLIALKHGNKIFAQTVSNMPKIKILKNRILPCKVSEIEADLDVDIENYTVRSVKEGLILQSSDLYDFVKGSLSKFLARTIMTLLGYKYGITIPLRYQNKIMGAVFYSKRIKQKFSENEIEILSLLNDQIAIAIRNAEVLNNLVEDVDNLKNKIEKIIYGH